MSDGPFSVQPVPITAEKARYFGCGYNALADELAENGVESEAAWARRRSEWWLTYAAVLAKTEGPAERKE